MDLLEVQPGIGIGDVRLGMPGRNIIELLGAPEGNHAAASDDGFHFESWFYKSLGVRVYMNVTWDRAVHMAGWNEGAHIDGRVIWGKPVSEVASVLKSLGYEAGKLGDPYLRATDEQPQVSLPDIGLDLKFASGILRIIGVRPLMDGDEIVWPS